MKIDLIFLTLAISIISCNTRNEVKREMAPTIVPESKTPDLDSTKPKPGTQEVKEAQSAVPKDAFGYKIPVTETNRKLKTDANFKDYYDIQVKNISKKIITNLLTVNKAIFGGKKVGVDNESKKNHRIVIKPGQTKSIKIFIDDNYRTPEILSARFSDGDSYTFFSLD